MTTLLYDIGDEINVTMKGRVISYSISENGDCYTIDLVDGTHKNSQTRVYLDTRSLTNNSSLIKKAEILSKEKKL